MPTHSESSALITSGQLVKALYDYAAGTSDGKVLTISTGELFIVIKTTKPDEWLYVVACDGRLGYVPANFVRSQQMQDKEFLQLLDGVLQQLESARSACNNNDNNKNYNNNNNVTTARQLNHARIKLTNVRSEIASKIQSDRDSVSTMNDVAIESVSGESVVSAEDQGVQTSPSLIESKEEDGMLSREDTNMTSDRKGKRVEEITVNNCYDAVDDCPSQLRSHDLHPDVDTRIQSVIEADVKEATDRSNVMGQETAKSGKLGPEETSKRTESPTIISLANPSSSHSDVHIGDDKHFESDNRHVTSHDGEMLELPQQQQANCCNEKMPHEEGDWARDDLASDLIERVRICSNMNYETCKTTVNVVVTALAEAFPTWRNKCNQIVACLHEDQSRGQETVASADSERIRAIFKQLWSCRNDEQQRSWPIQEDESMILDLLQELETLLKDANPAVTREILSQNYFAQVHSLSGYYLMEVRKSIRVKLGSVFLQIIRLNNSLIPNFFLTSDLSHCLAEEMLNHIYDNNRWSMSAQLFTAIFSTGHKPLNTLYDNVNEKFVSRMINIIERVDEDGNKVDTVIPSESSIPPILAFNLHFDSRESNLVLRALKMRKTATQLTENLVSYLNWGEDPTTMPNIVSSGTFEHNRPNAVHKLLIEILDEQETAKLFYLNDIRVVVDIVITHLSNAGEMERLACLQIAERVLKNTAYLEDPHKPEQLLKCLNRIVADENCAADEKCVAGRVMQLLLSRGSD